MIRRSSVIASHTALVALALSLFGTSAAVAKDVPKDLPPFEKSADEIALRVAKYGLGFIPATPEQLEKVGVSKPAELLKSTARIPQSGVSGLGSGFAETYRSHVDLSPYMPPPGQQGSQGSCVGWATAYAVKSYQEIKERHWVPGRPQTTFSPAFIYNQIHFSGCGNGSSIYDAMNLMADQGVATWEDFPYSPQDCRAKPSTKARKSAQAYKIASFAKIDWTNLVEDSKAHLRAGIPVVIGMLLTSNFYFYEGGVFDVALGRYEGGHAMAVVGYDDQLQAFKVINSWGRGWGMEGYAWISYRIFDYLVTEAWVAIDKREREIGDDSGESPEGVTKRREVIEGITVTGKQRPISGQITY